MCGRDTSHGHNGVGRGFHTPHGTGFDLDHFAIDWDERAVTCPQGKRSRPWEEATAPTGRAQFKARFHAGDCRACACRDACTRRKTEPRARTLLPQAEYEALRAARLRQATPAYKAAYAARAGIEGTFA